MDNECAIHAESVKPDNRLQSPNGREGRNENEAIPNEGAPREDHSEDIKEVFTDTEEASDSETRQEDKTYKVKKRVAWLEDRIRDSFILGCQKPFTPGATDFEHEPSRDGKIRKLLCHNSCGRISLALDPDDLTTIKSTIDSVEGNKTDLHIAYELRNQWMNVHAKGTIEVECFEAGEGKRTQDFLNTRGYHLASISGEGFVLGRSGMYSSPAEDANWLPSLIEYRPFTTRLSTIQKGSWCHCLAMGEVLVCISVGSSHVVACSDAPRPTIRVLSLTGIILYTSVLSFGVPISVASSTHVFIVLEQAPRCALPWDFKETQVYTNELLTNTKSLDFNLHFDRYERLAPIQYRTSVYITSRFPLCDNQGSWVHLAHQTQLILYGSDEVVFLTFSRDGDVPIIATKQGFIYGLAPISTDPGWIPSDLSQYSELAQLCPPASCDDEAKARIDELKFQSGARFVFEWLPLSESLLRLTKQKIYYVSAENESVRVVLYETFLVIPLMGEVFSNVKLIKLRTPLCLPLSFMSLEELPLDIERWCKSFNDDIATLPWPFLDEYRYRKSRQDLCQSIWKTSLQIVDADSEKVKQTKKLIEILTLKECVKILQENLNDTLSEATKHLAYSSSLNYLNKCAVKKGERLLAEEISNIKQSKDLLKELRHNLITGDLTSSLTEAGDLPASLPRPASPIIGDTTSAKMSPLGVNANAPKATTQSLESLIQRCVTKKRRVANQ